MSLDNAVQTLLKRLETVTARLESVEKQLASGAVSGGLAAGASASSGASAGSDDVSASVADYDQLIADHIAPLIQVSKTIGNDELKQQINLLDQAIQAQRQFLVVVSKSKKPDDATFAKLLDPTSKLMGEIGTLREKNRANKQFNHLSSISEGISAIGWVAVTPKPGPFADEARASAEFYTNKILVEFKKTDENQVKFANGWINFLKELSLYIKKYHTTGLTWNAKGGDAGHAAQAPAPKAGGAPPPPGPPPPAASLAAPAKAADTGALFASLNKGEAVTSGLKKVTKEMKTKNDPTRSSLVPATEAKEKAPPKAAAGQKKGTPKFELEGGKKWVVEWQENNNNIEINETATNQSVYVYKCEKTTVKVNGKVNNVVVDSCKRVGVVFTDAIATCEVVNSSSIDVQCTGKVPAIAVDKCSGVQIYLSKTGLDVEIVTSKSDAMNILIPDPAGSPDPVEYPVPEQFKTVIRANKLVTTTLEHSG